MPEKVIDQRGLGRATLARQMLLERVTLPVPDAVGALAGMQAQEPKPPYLGLWTRLDGFGHEDLYRAVQDGDVVRATMMRATLHFMSASDYARLRPALQPALDSAMRVLGERAKGLDLKAVLPAARRLLTEQPRTFDEIRNLLQQEFPAVNERALGYAVRMCVPLVMVPTSDRFGYPGNARFALTKVSTKDAAEVEDVVRRYLAAFGPATPADFQTWSGLGGAKKVFDGMRDHLVCLRDERKRELFDLPDAPRPGSAADAPPRFLPEFDNLVLAHQDRSRFVADAYRGEITTRGLRVRATFWWDGRVAGVWDLKKTRKVATLRMQPFETVPARALKALKAEAERVIAFAEPDATAEIITP